VHNSVRALKGTVSAEPFVDHNAQGVLIAARTRLALDLFGRHVGDGTDDLLGALNCAGLDVYRMT